MEINLYKGRKKINLNVLEPNWIWWKARITSSVRWLLGRNLAFMACSGAKLVFLWKPKAREVKVLRRIKLHNDAPRINLFLIKCNIVQVSVAISSMVHLFLKLKGNRFDDVQMIQQNAWEYFANFSQERFKKGGNTIGKGFSGFWGHYFEGINPSWQIFRIALTCLYEPRFESLPNKIFCLKCKTGSKIYFKLFI